MNSVCTTRDDLTHGEKDMWTRTMQRSIARLSLLFTLILTFLSGFCFGQTASQLPAAPNYNQLISTGNDYLKEGKLKDAYSTAMVAVQAEASRFEAYALAALALHGQGADADAKKFVEKAFARAPEGKKPLLNQMAKLIDDAIAAASASDQIAPTPDTRRRMAVLQLIMADADKATTATERNRLLNEFLDQSSPFVKEHPDQINIWVLRAVAALEVNKTGAGSTAGRRLIALGQDRSDQKIQKVLAMLERKGWLNDKIAGVADALVGVWKCKSSNALQVPYELKITSAEPLTFSRVSGPGPSKVWPLPGSPPHVETDSMTRTTSSCVWANGNLQCTTTMDDSNGMLAELQRKNDGKILPHDDWVSTIVFNFTQSEIRIVTSIGKALHGAGFEYSCVKGTSEIRSALSARSPIIPRPIPQTEPVNQDLQQHVCALIQPPSYQNAFHSPFPGFVNQCLRKAVMVCST